MIKVAKKSSCVIAILCIQGFFTREVEAQGTVGHKPPAGQVAASAAEAKIEIAYADGKLTADLKNAEIKDVLMKIGQAVNAQVEIGVSVAGKVTTSFQNLGLEDSFAALISGEGTGIVLGYDAKETLKFIKISKQVDSRPAQITKVRTISSFFPPQDMPDTLSMKDTIELVRDLRDEGKKSRWGKLAESIINVRDKAAKPYLKELMNHREDYIRWEATDAFSRLVEAEDADFILDMAISSDWEKRAASASIAMLLVDDPRQIPLLLDMVRDNRLSVRVGAAKALGDKRVAVAVPCLKELLTDPEAKYQAAEALYEITGQKYEIRTPEENGVLDERKRRFLEKIRKAGEK